MNEDVRVEYCTPNELFWRVLSAHRKVPAPELQAHFAERTILALDPGETTGVAIWEGSLERVEMFQLETKDVGQAFDTLREVVCHFKPDHIRAEEYRVYNWMAESHSWSVLHTPQLIGAIRVLAHLEKVPLTLKLAQHAKATWNDSVLKQSGCYTPGLKHARDACRHLLFYMSKPSEQD